MQAGEALLVCTFLVVAEARLTSEGQMRKRELHTVNFTSSFTAWEREGRWDLEGLGKLLGSEMREKNHRGAG